MAEVIKVIEDVDKLFSQIIVNNEVHESSRYVPSVTVAQSVHPQPTQVISQQETQVSEEPVQGEDVYAVELNNVLHDFDDRELALDLDTEITARQNADTALQGNITAEATARQNADTALSNDITAEATARQNADTTLQGNITAEATARQNADTALGNDISAEATARQNADTALGGDITANTNAISAINAKIPNQASAQNQLADKAFVNSSVATNTANYISNNGLPFNSLAELEAYSGTVTNNDYAFVTGTDSAGNTYYDRYKATVVGSTVTWALEYRLNNSSFTAEQWATINSGLTQSSVDSSMASAIGDLDVASVGGTGKFIESISEVDGKIVPVEKSLSTAVTSGDSKPVTSDAVYQAIQGAGITAVDVVQSGNMNAVTSNAVANYKPANATHADSADSATNASHASSADSATNASHASSADSATNASHASSADSATNASHASSADSATNATNASSVELNANNIIKFKETSLNGYKIQDVQTNALYVEGREGDSGDSGGVVITNDSVTAFGAGDTDGVFRVVNEDNPTGGAVFKVMKDGTVYGGVYNGKATQAGRVLIEGSTWEGHFWWSGQNAQPYWVWGSNDGVNMYVWNPANFQVSHANTASGVAGGMTGVGSGTVYSVDGSNFYNAYSRPVIVVSRFNAGYGVYFTNATIIQPNSYGAVVNFNDGKDFWFALA